MPTRPAQNQTLLESLQLDVNNRFAAENRQQKMAYYRGRPRQFAFSILGSRWWHRQEDIANMLVNHRRVIVKSANGVGKTYLAADLALWFLYSYPHSIVLTTAPTWRQVRYTLWEEIHKRLSQARNRNRNRSLLPLSCSWERGPGGEGHRGAGG